MLTTMAAHKTALHDRHVAAGAAMVDFHGWLMPIQYTSIIDEHHAMRRAVGMTDISHMGQVEVDGPQAAEGLQRLMTNDLRKLTQNGQALYTLMLNEQGGIIDDLIVYRLEPQRYLVIVNCGGRTTDLDWMRAHAGRGITVKPIWDGRGMLAVQGPKAGEMFTKLFGKGWDALERFTAQPRAFDGKQALVSRTGYTGSDGFEVCLEDAALVALWDRLMEQQVTPVGLGARDTLRLEAGYRLYGNEMDEATSPWEVDLGWTVALDKGEFIGREAALQQRRGIKRKLVGFVMRDRGIPRHGCEMTVDGKVVGQVTSGSVSPSTGQNVGLGYVPLELAVPETKIWARIRGRDVEAQVVKLPFWKGPFST